MQEKNEVLEQEPAGAPQQDREYLDFPNLSADRYKEIRAGLKEVGVKFDYKKKDWYVTAEADRAKLAGLREQIYKETGKEQAQPEGQPYFKGFAQAAGQEKPTVVFGNSKEEILARLNSWNRARAENNRFETCNIGQLDEESNKYTGYHKYDMDGNDISNIYLKIPPMGKDRFQQTLSDLKDAGAKYNPAKKQWYVKYDADMDVIEKILVPENGLSKELQEAATYKTENTDSLEAMGYRHVGDMPEYTLKGIFYSVELPGQGRTVMISADRVGLPGEDAVDLINRLEDAILEEAANAPKTVLEGQTSQAVQLEIPEEPEYRFSVSRAPMENRCTIWFADGRDPIHLDGQNFGVDFSLMKNERVSDFVKGYLEHDGLSVPKLPSYVEGDRIDCYLQTGEDGSFSHVTGEITEIWTHDSGRKTVYEIRGDDGQYLSTDSRQVFQGAQKEVLERAAKDGLSKEQYDMVADNRLTSAQMEEIRFAFKDGLSTEQIKGLEFGRMEPWQMDLARYGLQHGVTPEAVAEAIHTEDTAGWADRRRAMDGLIKENRLQIQADFKRRGFSLTPSLVRKMETVNHYTHHRNSLREIADAYRVLKKDPANAPIKGKAAEALKDVGRELELQQRARQAAMMASRGM